MSNIAIRNLISGQVPDFVRGDYTQFLTFLEKYYEWMEQTGNVVAASRALINGNDIDLAESVYFEKLREELTPYFPKDILGDKTKFLKIVSEYYKAKGTPKAVQFFFRVFYGEEINVYFPKEDILKASDGKWILPKSLRIASRDANNAIIYDPNIFELEKRKITGTISKATAIVEKVVESVDREFGISYIELYISNIERLFQTGEDITSTFTDTSNNVITVTGQLIGSLAEIKIDPSNRGLYYNTGDPVSIIGGLNPNANVPIPAVAEVGDVSQGSLDTILLRNPGFGFRLYSEANTGIVDFYGGFEGVPFKQEAAARISLVDGDQSRTLKITSITLETLNTAYANIGTIIDLGSTANTVNAISTYQTLNVFPIAYVTLTTGGAGYKNKPSVDIYSFFKESSGDQLVIGNTTLSGVLTADAVQGTNYLYANTSPPLTSLFEVGDYARLYNSVYEGVKIVTGVTSNTLSFSTTFANDIPLLKVYKMLRRDLKNIGALGRIIITDGGQDYAANDYLVFTGGSGYGANAKVTAVHAANSGIKTIVFNETANCVTGGEGYHSGALPTITVTSANGVNAVLSVAEVSGDGEELDFSTTKVGSITNLHITSYGFDYMEAPIVSLRNALLTLANVTEGGYFTTNTQIYQGASNTNFTFSAMVDKFTSGASNTGTLLIYNYTGSFNPTQNITSGDTLTTATVLSSTFYGDGKAKATATFRNGLIQYPGIYLNTDGHISSDKKLQDLNKYQNFSYEISTKTDLNKFKDSFSSIGHPIGMKIFVDRTVDSSLSFSANANSTILLETALVDTFNVAASANSVVSTNGSANLSATVNVGDTIILRSLKTPLPNSVNVSTGSNNVIGMNTNFRTNLFAGDTINISTGNTETITSVESDTLLITQNTIGVTATGATINVVFDASAIVNQVNATTLLVDTIFAANNSYLAGSLVKMK